MAKKCFYCETNVSVSGEIDGKTVCVECMECFMTDILCGVPDSEHLEVAESLECAGLEHTGKILRKYVQSTHEIQYIIYANGSTNDDKLSYNDALGMANKLKNDGYRDVYIALV